MPGMTDYLENALCNHVFRNTAMTSPTTVYVALHTADPTDAGTTGEVSTTSTGYARTAVTFGAPSNGVITNSGAVTFPTATGSWGTITHFSIKDASTSGNTLVYGALTASKTVASGDSIQFATGQLSITLD